MTTNRPARISKTTKALIRTLRLIAADTSYGPDYKAGVRMAVTTAILTDTDFAWTHDEAQTYIGEQLAKPEA